MSTEMEKLVESNGHTKSHDHSEKEFDLVIRKLSQACFAKLIGSIPSVEEEPNLKGITHRATIIIHDKSSSFSIALSSDFNPKKDNSLLNSGSEQPSTEDVVKEHLNWLAGAVRNYLNTKGIKSTQSPAHVVESHLIANVAAGGSLHNVFWQLSGIGLSVVCHAAVKSQEWNSLGTWSLNDINEEEDDDSFEILG